MLGDNIYPIKDKSELQEKCILVNQGKININPNSNSQVQRKQQNQEYFQYQQKVLFLDGSDEQNQQFEFNKSTKQTQQSIAIKPSLTKKDRQKQNVNRIRPIFLIFSIIIITILLAISIKIASQSSQLTQKRSDDQNLNINLKKKKKYQQKDEEKEQQESDFSIQIVNPKSDININKNQLKSQHTQRKQLQNYITQIPNRQTRVMPSRKDKYKYPSSKQYVYGDQIDYFNVKRIMKLRQSIATTYNDLERALKFHQLLGKNIQQDQKLSNYAQMQKDYYNKTYNIFKYEQEIEICLIVTSYDNQRQKRYVANLDSIFQQQYGNYFVIYINDFSNDKTGELVQMYLDQNPKAKQRTTLVNNTQNKLKSKNQYEAGHKYCKPGSIMFVCDGDDTLIGRQVFRFLNAVYQQHNALFVYLNFLEFKRHQNQTDVLIGRNQLIPQNVTQSRSYRQEKRFPSNPRTWMSDIFLNISYQNYTYKGQFVTAGQDIILMPSLQQLSGDRIIHLPDLVYEYNSGTGLNDHSSMRVNEYRLQLLENVLKLQPLKQYGQKIQYRMKKPNSKVESK